VEQTLYEREHNKSKALAARRPLDPNDTDVYALISRVRGALDELADALEAGVS
jgi:hypothetical protein